MITVLVTAIGSLAADIVIKNLKKEGYQVVGSDIYPKEWIVDAYSVDRFFQVPLAADSAAYVNALIGICMENKVNYLIPLTDVEIDVLKNNRNLFDVIGTTICISSDKTIEICRDKRKTAQYLQQASSIKRIPTLSASQISLNSDFNIGFPMIAKPYNGRSSNGIQRIHTTQELDVFLDSKTTNGYIIQPFISGKVVTVDVIRQADGKKIIAIPRLENLRTANGLGTSVHIFHDHVLQEECCLLADHLEIIGCVNFEFIKTGEGCYYFLECNPRFSGGVEFSCMVGYDLISNHIRCFMGEPIDELESYRDCYIARKYEETITAYEK